METQLSGLICSFKQENGFGTLELEDGREILFDVTACVEEPLEGQPVRVVLGAARTGVPRAVLVEVASQPESTRPATTLPEALRRLQAEGIALELDEYERRTIAERLGQPGELPSELVSVLSEYYRDDFVGERRRTADLYLDHRGDVDTLDFERSLAVLLGGNAVTFDATEVNVRSVDDVVDAFNEELRGSGDARRIVPLATEGEHRAYFCMALSRALRLSAVGVLRVCWGRPHLTPSEPPPRNA
ncbi:MAG: hypothetical protein IPI67_02300 [Myxococcales bacterium]|nr:hypothetical protein [Myxococcales bacterium]